MRKSKKGNLYPYYFLKIHYFFENLLSLFRLEMKITQFFEMPLNSVFRAVFFWKILAHFKRNVVDWIKGKINTKNKLSFLLILTKIVFSKKEAEF